MGSFVGGSGAYSDPFCLNFGRCRGRFHLRKHSVGGFLLVACAVFLFLSGAVSPFLNYDSLSQEL